MHCPACGEDRPRRDWRDSQWVHRTAFAKGYDSCKQCWARGPTAEEREEYAAHLDMIKMDVEAWGSGQVAFIEEWFGSRSQPTRKWLSHRGAIPRRQLSDPGQWLHRRSETWHFDPGNAVYKDAIRRTFPVIFNRLGISNEVTCGDLLESILGYCFILREGTAEVVRPTETLDSPFRCGITLREAEHFWLAVVYHAHRISRFTYKCWDAGVPVYVRPRDG
jgi:hypothetical protein